ncbi:MAG: hypothetical protein QHI48_06755, partial [Bacteroidota bacterium]|nr:hypothetical protein [Bacteroidota bacterium]
MTKRIFHNDTMENEVVRVLQRQQSLRRITFLVILFLCCFALVVFRLAMIQIRDSAMLREIAFEQYQSREILPPIRGLIFDRNLSILASNLIEYRLTADPSVIQRPDTVAIFLARHFPGSVSFYREKLSDRSRRYVVLHNRLPESAAAVFASWRCYGVSLVKVPRRYYTFGPLASCVLGFTNIENRGQTG